MSRCAGSHIGLPDCDCISLIFGEFEGHHSNQTCYKSGIMSPGCVTTRLEIKGADGGLWSGMQLEQADTQVSRLSGGSSRASIEVLSKQKNAPSNLTSFTCHRRASSAYLAPATAGAFQLPPSPTLVAGPRLATRDTYHLSTSMPACQVCIRTST